MEHGQPPSPPIYCPKEGQTRGNKTTSILLDSGWTPLPLLDNVRKKDAFFLPNALGQCVEKPRVYSGEWSPSGSSKAKTRGAHALRVFGFGFGQTDDMGWLAFRCCPATTQFQASGRYSKAHCSHKEKIWHGLGHYSSYTLRPIGLLKWPGKNFYWCGCIRLYPERHFCWIGQCFNSTPFQIRIWNGPSW